MRAPSESTRGPLKLSLRRAADFCAPPFAELCALLLRLCSPPPPLLSVGRPPLIPRLRPCSHPPRPRGSSLVAVSYPPAFGEPPRMQTRDLRPLPFGYGMGSGTIATWLSRQAEAVYGETVDEYVPME